jgi:hypothetical protein
VTCLGRSRKNLTHQSDAFFACIESWSLIQLVDIESQVSLIADINRVTYREEPTDYFPGVKDPAPSKSISLHPVSGFGPSGSPSRGEAEMLPLDAGQSSSKRQRLDDG